MINDFLKRCPANCLRFLILKNLWRSPVDYSEALLIETRAGIERMEEFLRKVKAANAKVSAKMQTQILRTIKLARKKFYERLDDDFNTPEAFAILFELVKSFNALLEKDQLSKTGALKIYNFFLEINKIFAIIDFKKVNKTIPTQIKKLVKQREIFRKNKDWQKADLIRQEIEKQGYTVQDSEKGPVAKTFH